MTAAPIRIWTRASHQPAFKCGGWAWVRAAPGGEAVGQAGGERDSTAARMALAGLAAALSDIPKVVPVALGLGEPALARRVAAVAAGRAFAADEAPSDDLDLWAQISTALAGRTIGLAPIDPRPAEAFKGSPVAFVQAWAELARDKAKSTGAFTATIPRPNLAKLNLG